MKRRKNISAADRESFNIESETIKKYRETIDDVLASFKYKSQTGQGYFFSNPKELLSRLELLGGSLSAGNNSNAVREEFAKIVHTLNKLNVIDNKQTRNLMKEYLI